MGNVAAVFSGSPQTPDMQAAQTTSMLQTMTIIVAAVALISISLFTFSYLFYAFWQHLAENITTDLRKKYIAALMKQEIAYFEVNKVEQIPAQIAEIFDTVQSSIGEKIANLIFAVSACVSGIVYALFFGWTFALACVAYLPVFLGILGVFGLAVKKSTMAKLETVK